MAKKIVPSVPQFIIVPGTKFDTEFEQGCIATSNVAKFGSFTAFDSDGVECVFNIAMVIKVHSK